MWDYYMNAPWTRDGRVRADVVTVAPDVAGLVTELRVADNQPVKAGDVLFTVDPGRYRLAVEQAQANLDSAQADFRYQNAEAERYRQLRSFSVSEAERQKVEAARDRAAGMMAQATAALDLARLNLARTEVRATVDGFVTNLQLRPGNYVAAGQPVVALIDAGSFHIVGYFEETKLARIRVGDRAEVGVMGSDRRLTGRVESIARGIADRDRTETAGQLPNVNPTFNWVRLAQRIPVRVALDPVPEGVRLVAGRTATVAITGPAPAAVAQR